MRLQRRAGQYSSRHHLIAWLTPSKGRAVSIILVASMLLVLSVEFRSRNDRSPTFESLVANGGPLEHGIDYNGLKVPNIGVKARPPTFESLLANDGPLEPAFDCNGLTGPNIGVKAHRYAAMDDSNSAANRSLFDFAVVGFPKCGTTSLISYFRDIVSKTDMLPKEYCEIGRVTASAAEELQLREEIRAEAEAMAGNIEGRKLAFKCPHLLKSAVALTRMGAMFPDMRLIVGVRHPVLWFESFYNFRVRVPFGLELGPKRKEWELWKPQIKLPETFIGFKNSQGSLDTDLCRYELTLMQLGKVPVFADEMALLACKRLTLSPTPSKVFLYSVEQLSDPDDARSAVFRDDLRNYLRLDAPLGRFPVSNSGKGPLLHPEMEDYLMNICDKRFDPLRSYLMKNARKTKEFILDRFIFSPDVVVGGKSHFIELLKEWDKDPCDSKE